MHLQRRLNYTGRKKINKSAVKIVLQTGDQVPTRFTAQLDLSGLGLPDSAPVYVEARQKDLLQRFDFGKAGKIKAPENTDLTEVDPQGGISFWVRVLDPDRGDGRLLAIAKSIKPEGDVPEGQGRDSLLPVRATDLGNVPWQIDFPVDEGVPVLEINNRIPGAMDKLKHDKTFQALILPGALREILTRIIFPDSDSEEDPWQDKWMEFANSMTGEKLSLADARESGFDWIDQVAKEFCNAFNLSGRLAEHYDEGGQA